MDQVSNHPFSSQILAHPLTPIPFPDDPGLANGVANLHNARRASTPILNIIGDMAVWHAYADAALSMDIEGLAATVSRHWTTPKSIDVLAEEAPPGSTACPIRALTPAAPRQP